MARVIGAIRQCTRIAPQFNDFPQDIQLRQRRSAATAASRYDFAVAN
jgi:hypothetical protein